MQINNPAGRLHAILKDFEETSSNNVSVQDCWCKVLGVPRSEVLVHLGETASLITQIRRALINAGLEDNLPTYDRYADAWARPFFAPDRPMANGSHNMVDEHAMATLSLLSSLLDRVAPEGAVPDEAQLGDLRTRLSEAVEEVLADDDLPEEIRSLILARLRDMLWAVEHIHVVGPDGVKAAAERLAVALAQTESRARNKRSWGKVAFILPFAWSIFSQGKTIEDNVGAWSRMIDDLPAIVQEHRPKEIGSRKEPAQIEAPKASTEECP